MILHLDMDAFFASIEQMDNPDLRGKPVIIGGGERGVVATASYEARVFGLHSAMPIATARKLCPQGIYIQGNFRRYREISHKIMDCLRSFSPVVQPASIDEAYIDVKNVLRLFGSPKAVGYAVKKSVRLATGGLTCSVGIAPVKFMAKICSDMDKPDGLFYLAPENVEEFLLKLKVTRLPGVGKKMAESLQAFGVTTVAQLRGLSRSFMGERYGKFGIVLHEKAFGIDPRPVHALEARKSESVEHTFERDVGDINVLREKLLAQAQKVGDSLRKHGVAGRTVTLKIKFADFQLITRSRTLPARTDSSRIIFEIAADLLANEPLEKPVRLIGVGLSGFDIRSEQLFLPGLENVHIQRRGKVKKGTEATGLPTDWSAARDSGGF